MGILDYGGLHHDTTRSNCPTLRLGWAKHVPKMRPEHANTYDKKKKKKKKTTRHTGEERAARA